MTVSVNANGAGRIRVRITIQGAGISDEWETGIRFDARQPVEAIKQDLDEAFRAAREKAREYLS